MVNETWIKLHSKLMNWEWYQDHKTKSLFIHCLLKANWQDGKYKGLDIPRGSFVTGRKKLSQELGMSEQEIRTCLKKLEKSENLTINATKQFSIISIKNYNEYQQRNQRATNEQPLSKNIDIINNYYLNKIQENFGRTIAPLEADLIESWVKEIDDTRKIDYAINETITNGVRNLRYTDKILKNIKNRNYEELIENSKEEDSCYVEIPDYDWLNEE